MSDAKPWEDVKPSPEVADDIKKRREATERFIEERRKKRKTPTGITRLKDAVEQSEDIDKVRTGFAKTVGGWSKK